MVPPTGLAYRDTNLVGCPTPAYKHLLLRTRISTHDTHVDGIMTANTIQQRLRKVKCAVLLLRGERKDKIHLQLIFLAAKTRDKVSDCCDSVMVLPSEQQWQSVRFSKKSTFGQGSPHHSTNSAFWIKYCSFFIFCFTSYISILYLSSLFE